jgi:hypothetical protein
MTTIFILENEEGEQRQFDSRAKAEKKKEELARFDIETELKQATTDGGAATVEVADTEEDNEDITDDELDADEEVAAAVNTANEIAQSQQETQASTTVGGNDLPNSPDVTEDPVSWMPEHFIDVIEGVPSVNRKGYAVLAKHFDITVQSEPITYPGESDWQYAEFRATATTTEGDTYTGYGSAHVDRGDDKGVLGELAETRACKRSISWATGVGMVAISEMRGDQEVVE